MLTIKCLFQWVIIIGRSVDCLVGSFIWVIPLTWMNHHEWSSCPNMNDSFRIWFKNQCFNACKEKRVIEHLFYFIAFFCDKVLDFSTFPSEIGFLRHCYFLIDTSFRLFIFRWKLWKLLYFCLFILKHRRLNIAHIPLKLLKITHIASKHREIAHFALNYQKTARFIPKITYAFKSLSIFPPTCSNFLKISWKFQFVAVSQESHS